MSFPISSKNLISLARNEDGSDGGRKTKMFQINRGDMVIYTGRAIVSVSNLDPLDDGIYDSKNPSVDVSGQQLAPSLLAIEKLPHEAEIPVYLIKQLHGCLQKWFSTRCSKEMFGGADDLLPYGKLSIGPDQVSFAISQVDGKTCDMGLAWPNEYHVDEVFEVAQNGKEFLDAFSLFAKLDETGFVTIHYGDPSQPWFITAESSGHTITVGLPFELDPKREAEPAEIIRPAGVLV